MQEKFQPQLMKPFVKEALWGGNRLRENWGKQAPPEMTNVAEAWELSTHPHGLSKIATGEFADKTFKQYLQEAGREILGRKHQSEDLSILVKYIDAADNLSIQVHPDDQYAKEHNLPSGKTEMWYVVEATPGAYIYYGFNKKIDKAEFEQRIAEQTLPEVLQQIKVKAGESYFIPAGTLHAIGPGCLIAEIQQSSDTTYRIYDYGRRDKDGNLRELHVEQAKEVTKLEPCPLPESQPVIDLRDGNQSQLISKCPFFQVHKVNIAQAIGGHVSSESFQLLMNLGEPLALVAENGQMTVEHGQSVFLAAGMGKYHLQGHGELLVVTL
ncbi:class I mannose-6-phosphate isomerase [bacterium]|nr:class I mannose-6-phosphate isomerase [bacterium]MBQ6436177.1 class I mannose-6-phosphate isomerase [bacterium]